MLSTLLFCLACGFTFSMTVFCEWFSRLRCYCSSSSALCFFFFFQAEDGIRDLIVTGVQTCALPISGGGDDSVAVVLCHLPPKNEAGDIEPQQQNHRRPQAPVGLRIAIEEMQVHPEIGRASCRERV